LARQGRAVAECVWPYTAGSRAAFEGKAGVREREKKEKRAQEMGRAGKQGRESSSRWRERERERERR
jgi:hypothetical protein